MSDPTEYWPHEGDDTEVIELHNLGITGSLQPVMPNKEELSYALGGNLLPCPFCGSSPALTMQHHTGAGNYQARIVCGGIGGCNASVLYNSKDRADAREKCIETWSTRVNVGHELKTNIKLFPCLLCGSEADLTPLGTVGCAGRGSLGCSCKHIFADIQPEAWNALNAKKDGDDD